MNRPSTPVQSAGEAFHETGVSLKVDTPPAPASGADEARAKIVAELAAIDSLTAGRNYRSLVDDEDRTVTINRQALETLLAFAARPAGEGEQLREALVDAIDWLRAMPLESGYCCCGNPVASHGLGDGHTPVDELAYSAGRLQERLTAARQERG
jgi:hypothetical protein